MPYTRPGPNWKGGQLDINMKKILATYKFDCIWHFTDRSNLESIEEHEGLLSLGEAERRGIQIPRPGGNQWSHDADKIKGLHEYVHLAFVKDHPMLFRAKEDRRILDPIWLKIKPSILLGEDVRFCSAVCNKTGVELLTAMEAEKEIDFEVLFTPMDWRDSAINARRQAAIKSEILIPRFIPIDQVLGFEDG